MELVITLRWMVTSIEESFLGNYHTQPEEKGECIII